MMWVVQWGGVVLGVVLVLCLVAARLSDLLRRCGWCPAMSRRSAAPDRLRWS